MYAIKILLPLIFWSFSLFAFIPKDFILPANIGGNATFVDFTQAKYYLTYDVANKKASYKAIITFTQKNTGKPIFDVVQKPKMALLEQDFVRDLEISTPNNETKVRIIDQELAAGSHTLTLEGDIVNLVKFDKGTVSAAHWTSDLRDRGYLENYLPTNLEYDQYSMTFYVNIIGTNKPHRLYANGSITAQNNKLKFKFTYPKYFTASSGFYHLAPVGAFEELQFDFTSVSGAKIPVLIYGKSDTTNFTEYKTTTLKTLNELESDYGAFPHPQVVVYNNGKGGMEYCGATMTEYWALEHELTHSYFARGLVPANGNAGWIDEAIASWRDDSYPRRTMMEGSSSLSSHAYYTRETDDLAYSYGANFISYLDGKIVSNVDSKGFKSFLKHAREKYLFVPYTVELFVQWMEEYYEFSLMHDFKTYTYTTTPPQNPPKNDPSKNNRIWGKNLFHQKLSIKELYPLL